MNSRIDRRLVGGLVCAGAVLALGCIAAQNAGQAAEHGVTGREPIVGLPCEGCEAVFQGIPDQIAASARIAPPDAEGEPLRLEGVVRRQDGSVATGVIVYAYHTDAEGEYPEFADVPGRAAGRHGRYRAWTRTDEQGRYRFDTIRPASYPETTVPQHIHMHIIEPGRCTYYIDDIHFTDDPNMTQELRNRTQRRHGGHGIVTPELVDGVWQVNRDIVLGLHVNGYPAR